MEINDPLKCTYLMLIWGIIFSFILYVTSDNDVFSFNIGPSEDRYFMAIHINSWFKWVLFALLIMVDKFINSISVDIIGNYINNNLHNENVRYLLYNRFNTFFIADLYSFYFNIRYIITLKLLISQIDYAILRAFTDVIATHYSISLHIKNKRRHEE